MKNFIKVFFNSFNASFFVSMLVLSSYVSNLVSKISPENLKIFIYFYIPFFNAIISSIIVLSLTKYFIKKKYISENKNLIIQKRNLKEIFFTAFIAGYISIFTGLSRLFMFLTTIFIIYITVHNIKSFTKKIKKLMAPHNIASSRDVGEFFSFFINLIITFTVINYSLFISHTILGTKPAFNFAEGLSGIIDSLYFTVVTMTTLGFGDFAPLSPLGRIAIIFESLISYIMFALMIGILSRGVNFKATEKK